MGKQFNIKGQNGLYLSNQPTTTVTSSNYQSLLIQDFDFFPKSKNEANLFDLKNVKYRPVLNQLYGSNSIAKSNSNIPHSYIFRGGNLIPNKKYFNTFKMYFNFTGSDLGTYAFPGFSTATLSSSVLNALRIKIYIQLGATLIPATLSNLQKVVANNAVASNSASWVNVVNATDVSGGGGNIAISDGTKTGIQLTTGLNSEPCIDMRWSTANIFKFLSTNGYGFRMDVSLGNLERQALKTKEYKIIVKYFNIGVTTSGVPSPYNTSESVELMSNNYIYYQKITIPVSISRIGGGGGYESEEADYDPGGGETT
jgi:hypothetical protein